MNEHPIFAKIINGRSPDFGDTFSKSIELFKKVWVQGFIHVLLNFVVLFPLIVLLNVFLGIAGLSIFGTSSLLQGMDTSESIEAVAATTLPFFTILFMILIGILFSILSFVVQFAITAHFFKVCKETDLGEPVSTDYFFYLKKRYFKTLSLLGICSFLIGAIAYMLCVLPIIYAIVPLQLFGVIFAFNPEMEVKEIVRAGFTFGNKVWGVTFGLLFVSFILSYIIGIIACGVGLLFTISFVYVPLYYVYKEGIGFSSGSSYIIQDSTV